jgi:hypothetical protein
MCSYVYYVHYGVKNRSRSCLPTGRVALRSKKDEPRVMRPGLGRYCYEKKKLKVEFYKGWLMVWVSFLRGIWIYKNGFEIKKRKLIVGRVSHGFSKEIWKLFFWTVMDIG